MEPEYSPWNGKPYYCCICGLNINEFMACELPDCKLESDESAQARQKLKALADSKGSTHQAEVKP